MRRNVSLSLVVALALVACTEHRPTGPVATAAAPSEQWASSVSATNPLTFVDGKEMSFAEARKTPADRIESVEVVKGAAAFQAYGERARDGVILIKLKK